MGLKATFVTLFMLTVSLLLGGVGVIYFDGYNEISLVENRSQDDLKKHLLFLDFVSKYKLFSQLPFNEIEKLNRAYQDLKSAKSEIQKHISGQSINLAPAEKNFDEIISQNRSFIKKREINFRSEKEARLKWSRLETKLSSEIVKKMKGGQEFLPDFKNTLSKWAEDIPFLEKIRSSLDVSYVNQNEFIELRDLMLFSEWIIDWRIAMEKSPSQTSKALDVVRAKLDSLKMDEKLKLEIKRDIFSYVESIREVLSSRERIQYFQSKLQLQKKMLLDFFNEEMIPSWQGNKREELEKEIFQKNERHKMIVLGAVVAVVMIILVMAILFLRIFPQLKILEVKAEQVGQGVFNFNSNDTVPKNEIGKVMQAFNNMSLKLHEYREKQKEDEKEKIRLSDSLQRLRKVSELGEFSAKMAHELKNPISILNFCLEDAMDSATKNEKERTLSELGKSIQALARLKVISSKLGSKNLLYESDVFNMREMINELVSMYSSLVSSEDIDLVVTSSHQANTMNVNASKLEIMGALSNLIDNGVDYIKLNPVTNKKIEVDLSSDGKVVYVTISNQGEEIPEDRNIFEGVNSSKPGIGRGLGLVIVKDAVERANGSVIYKHEEGKNRFIISIPEV